MRVMWSFEELAEHVKSQDPEVRYWAVDRLIRHYPGECCDTIAELLLDDHDATPAAVARHLGEHGAAAHHPVLVRGFRVLRGLTPGLCLQALCRLGYRGVVDLAATGLKRDDLGNRALALMVESLAALATPEARALVREFAERRIELLAEPSAMRGVLGVVAPDEIPKVLGRFFKALEGRGGHRAGEVFRSIMDTLRIDDSSWCFRTGPSGHVELRKTIKAVESGYDCDISGVIGKSTISQIAQRFRAGQVKDVVRALAAWSADAAREMPRDPGDDLPDRMAAGVGAFADPDLLDDVARLGGQVQQWVLGFQLSAAFTIARGLNLPRELKRARGDLEALLRLAEVETAFLLDELPAAIAVVCRDEPRFARQAQDWSLRMLEAQGPFFPKVIALATLGELRSVHFVPEIMDYLSDENSYVYGAAERALSKMGEAIIAPAMATVRSGTLDSEIAHSMLVLLCDLGTRAAYEAVSSNLDWFMDAVGPGTAAEWVSLFGAEDLIEPLRDWLDEDPALVGQGLLLLGAIHNVPIPEEKEILLAIEEDEQRDRPESPEDTPPDGSDQEGGGYVM